MLRNLNRSFTRGRICGTPKCGVLGSTIPSSGANGPGYTYNDLALPGDAGKDICGRITTWPATGTLFAYEDTSFDYTPAGDGAESFQYQLYVDGVAVGAPQTVTLTSGASSTTINGIVGSAAASGFTASVATNVTIYASVGSAGASGATATITTAGTTTVSASVGSAAASGFTAVVDQGCTISVAVGSASASGFTASVHQGIVATPAANTRYTIAAENFRYTIAAD